MLYWLEGIFNYFLAGAGVCACCLNCLGFFKKEYAMKRMITRKTITKMMIVVNEPMLSLFDSSRPRMFFAAC